MGGGQGADGGGAGQFVESAVAAGGRREPRGARHRQEADLAGAAGGSPAESAVEDDRGADALAEPEEDEVLAVPGRAFAEFGEGGEVGLVLDEDLGGQPLLEDADEPAVPGGQAGGVAQLAAGRVDEAGSADGHGVQPVGARLLHGPFQEGDGLLDGGTGAVVVADGYGGLRERGAEQVGDGDGDGAGADVERGEVGAVGDDPVQLGVGAPAYGSGLPHDVDESGALEPLDEVGDGGPGESGEVLELSGRQRAFVLEQSQGDPVVDGSCGARGCGHAAILSDGLRWGSPFCGLFIRQGS
ncbi:hypothetical protein SVEN_1047 [Streptomyces venezuelae ATCC 10712]|uniref:Uncharacterized protein n=1 Tax=Streptomyces venezuelae (strain ATCC 10712 / CBS 650.69 / DSM 40230 / JCM 4526 / NBRC 13096 / PD 04745) TaxID=953739 RepID=F2RCH6_STRVP|nr:hypothetical protein SVEN_1047 [Streptomyces venezuelae ATCC 10712]